MTTAIIGTRESRKNRQHGATLITALIMLVVLTLLAVSGIRSSSTNLRIAGNMQAQAEGIAASQQVIERIISNADFTSDSFAITVSERSVTINNMPYWVEVARNCKSTQPLKNEDLNLSSGSPDLKCVNTGAAPNVDIFQLNAASAVTVTPGPSGCSAQHWEIKAGIPDASTVVQGVFIRVATAGASCP